MRHISISIAAVLSAGFALPTYALTATQSIEKEIVVQNADGTETVKRVSAEKVVPGERIVYMLNFENDKTDAASNLVLTMPVPEAVTFIEGTAENSFSNVTYSADGGQTFALRDRLTVTRDDGSTAPAQTADITHVRWLVAGPVAPGDSGELSFKGELQ